MGKTAMNTPANSNDDPLLAEFEAAQTSIEQALFEADNGGLYSIHDVQLYIEKLCTRLAELPGAQQTDAKNRVVDLLVSLDKLTDKLVEQKEALGQQIAALPNSARAATAYVKASTPAQYKGSNDDE
jgi:hypothetical protein